MSRPGENPTMCFAKRIGIIAGAILGVAAVTGLIWRLATADLRAALAVEVTARMEADAAADARLDRLANIVELAVVAVAEEPNSAQRAEALDSLRRMRRIEVR